MKIEWGRQRWKEKNIIEEETSKREGECQILEGKKMGSGVFHWQEYLKTFRTDELLNKKKVEADCKKNNREERQTTLKEKL